MVERIDPGQLGGPLQPGSKPRSPQDTGGPSFKETMKAALSEVNDMTASADEAVEKLVTGQTDNVGEVMSAVQKADLAFSALQQIRNKLVEAYQEIQQMRI
ncbi:MAG: flagellar hook-basal body complex protein FliE [Planctomycetota bacterium]